MPFNFKNLLSVKFLQARYLSTSPVKCQFGNFRKILIRSDVLEFIKFRKNAPCLISHRLFHPGGNIQFFFNNEFPLKSVLIVRTYSNKIQLEHINLAFSEQAQLDHLRSKPDKKAWFGLACGCISVTIIGFLTVGKFMQTQKASTRAKLLEQIQNGEVFFFFHILYNFLHSSEGSRRFDPGEI